MEKFHFNPMALTKEIREYFPNLQTLYQYSSHDELFEDDKRIIARDFIYLNKYLKYKERKQLEEWTGLKCSEILFDSDIDNWSQNTSVFDERIIGKKQITLIIEDENEEKFGYYLNTQVIEKYYTSKDPFQQTDSKTFHFNLQSKTISILFKQVNE